MDNLVGVEIPYNVSINNQSRNCGIESLGYLLDLLDIVDPKIAKYEECLEIILSSLRKNSFPFSFLGACIDDALNLRGTHKTPFDILSGIPEVKKFRDKLIPLLATGELEDLIFGINTPIEKLVNPNFPFSQN